LRSLKKYFSFYLKVNTDCKTNETDMNFINTKRLKLDLISVKDCDFIIELVNTEGWISYIGNRNIRTRTKAKTYIENFKSDKNTIVRIIKLKETNISIGIITILKRDYLEYCDIGFALLPEYSNQGFAFEAAEAVINIIKESSAHKYIQATTVPDNLSSIKLLKKLAFKFEKKIEVEKKTLNVYILKI